VDALKLFIYANVPENVIIEIARRFVTAQNTHHAIVFQERMHCNSYFSNGNRERKKLIIPRQTAY
jgi:hypothetical protein